MGILFGPVLQFVLGKMAIELVRASSCNGAAISRYAQAARIELQVSKPVDRGPLTGLFASGTSHSYEWCMADSDGCEALFKAVGARVRELRMKSGLNQPEFAKAAGVSTAYAWRIEDGRQNLSLRTLSRIAIALDVPMSTILEGIQADPQSLENRPYRSAEAKD